jgi:predicted ATPase
MTVVTGVSGSGKSSLVKKVFHSAVKKITGGYSDESGQFDKISGDYHRITAVEFVDQNPIGKSTRSNPVTYVKAYDEIRGVFSELPIAKARKYKPFHFSLMWMAVAVKFAKARVKLPLKCSSWLTYILLAKPVMANVLKKKFLTCNTKAKTFPMYWT